LGQDFTLSSSTGVQGEGAGGWVALKRTEVKVVIINILLIKGGGVGSQL